MAVHSLKRQVSDAENKLRLLYCVNALHQVSETQLWPFVASLGLMEYMPMQLLLHELLSCGDLEQGEEAQKGLITLSSGGQKTLHLFLDRIMSSDREQIDREAPAYRKQLQKNRQIRAVYESAREGEYIMRFFLMDGEVPTLNLRMKTAFREDAAKSRQAFEEKGAAILSYLYGLGESGHASGEEGAIKAEKPEIISHSLREHAVTAKLSAKRAEFEMTLLLPSEEWAVSFQTLLTGKNKQNEIAQQLYTLLCENNHESSRSTYD